MAQCRAFNNDFTDEHVDWLIRLAPAATDSRNCFYTCGWATPLGICSASVQGSDFSEHLRVCHSVAGPDKAQLKCCWTACGIDMNKESVIRHVQEVHLEWKYACPHCQERFTRSYTMQSHMKRQHFGG